MVNFALQRTNMVESQIRPSDITDRRIIRAMLEIPREIFVPQDVRALAYMDQEVRITAAGAAPPRALLAPRVHARMIQALELDRQAVVLDVGCGTGYGSAIMARLSQTVVGLEADPALAEAATQALASLSVDNVVIVTGPHGSGWPDEGPYDAILLEGAVPEIPSVLLDQLKDGGRLIGVVSDAAIGKATLWRRSRRTFSARVLFDAGAPQLVGFERKPQFVF